VGVRVITRPSRPDLIAAAGDADSWVASETITAYGTARFTCCLLQVGLIPRYLELRCPSNAIPCRPPWVLMNDRPATPLTMEEKAAGRWRRVMLGCGAAPPHKQYSRPGARPLPASTRLFVVHAAHMHLSHTWTAPGRSLECRMAPPGGVRAAAPVASQKGTKVWSPAGTAVPGWPQAPPAPRCTRVSCSVPPRGGLRVSRPGEDLLGTMGADGRSFHHSKKPFRLQKPYTPRSSAHPWRIDGSRARPAPIHQRRTPTRQ
jgi:hypothetical protein